jgi:hypothetical protein
VNLWEYATTEIYAQIKEDLPKEALGVSACTLKLLYFLLTDASFRIGSIRMGCVLAAE